MVEKTRRNAVRSLITGGVMLILAGMSIVAVRRAWIAGEGEPPPSFWWWLALTLFLVATVQLNLIGGMIDLFSRPPQPTTLPVRLAPLLGEPRRFTWAMLSLALAFGLPIVPLVLLIVQVSSDPGYDWTLFAVGAVIGCAILGGATAVVGMRALYQLLVGGRAWVETDRMPVHAGEDVRFLVRYQAGRVPPDMIGVRLLCEHMRREGPSNNRTLRTHVVVQQQLLDPEPWIGPQWERMLVTSIPPNAPGTITGAASVTWRLEIRLQYARLPETHEEVVVEVIGVEEEEREA